MKIVIFGASGRTGVPLLQQALERGHVVTAFMRDRKKLNISHENLLFIEGDVLNPDDVQKAVKGQDAVISVIGHTKNSPKDLLSKATQNILRSMSEHNVQRIISLTGAGVKVPKDVKQGVISQIIEQALKLFARELWEDSVKQKELIIQSAFIWTIVRGPRLLDGEKTEKYQTGYFKFSKPMVYRADIAHFMLEELEKNEYVKESPLIASK